ncbi:hypothetical protein DESUT3_04660 [Desulfuromonas versatilis]|uniref:Carboxypeptidase regulatory-like domain-containing protein n=1 Tax=Desulfuromonas versatilis TaxID=2802975 RepID=A0ABN6DUI4_9BACT|nr:carboxypeptidase-like regulatory domain-containing protein [Desulfuromonas versatilis]BCR03397.1 hypothetical protein DESUT3_04660 [Desulfuromonas versatilis]
MNRASWWKGLLLLLIVFNLPACLPLAERASETATSGDLRVSRYVDGQGKTGITGQVVHKDSGAPLAEAYVNIYPDAVSNLLGPSQYISSPTDAEGRYNLEVPPGTYYVVARKRMSGQAAGPLAQGDYYSEHQRVITTVEEGTLALVDLQVVPMKAPMFFQKSVVDKRTETGIRGRLVDAAGKPVPGSFAVAYTDSDVRRLPDFASTLSDQQGNFTIFLPKGGVYYLAGRLHAWDMPRPGELYGRLGGEEPAPVEVVPGGFVENILIEMTPFSGEYKPGKSRRPY